MLRRSVLALTVASALGLSLPGAAALASGAVGATPVATVGTVAITRGTFDHWMVVAADSAGGPEPVPPNYKACIDAGRRPGLSDRVLRLGCSRQYEQLKQQVMQFLISAQWLLGECVADGISVSQADVVSQFDQLKRQQFPTSAAYRQFLAANGMTTADLLWRVKLNLLSQRLQLRALGPALTPSQIEAYYRAHLGEYTVPAHRFAHLVVTRTRAGAERALRELRAGATFAVVARQLSVDATTRLAGGRTGAIYVGTFGNPLGAALQRAQPGVLRGPLRGRGHYYVYEVDRVVAATPLPLTSVTQLILATVQTERVTAFVASFTARWQAQTTCRRPYVVSGDCGTVD